MSDRLFDPDDVPTVPVFREPRRRVAARGIAIDARFANDYPTEWHKCTRCVGTGWIAALAEGNDSALKCPDCLGMGSLKARVRLEAGHRCERCLHPYVPKGDAQMLGVEPSPSRWSPCDMDCTHGGPIAYYGSDDAYREIDMDGRTAGEWSEGRVDYFAEWRILTVHHLDGDKANCRWWNLAALCQRCHLEIQAKVVMERVYPHEHSEWFKPHAAGWYAFTYLGEDLTRDEVAERQQELLELELIC